MSIQSPTIQNISIAIEKEKAHTLLALLQRLHRERELELSKVLVAEIKRDTDCPACSHYCTKRSYLAYGFTGPKVAEHITCDCGYVYVMNTGGKSFAQLRDMKRLIFDTGTGKTLKKPDREEAQRIIESLLIEEAVPTDV